MNQEHFTEDGEERISTGIPGLDNVLCGGVDAERLYLVEGEPGTGKTTLALQFLLEGARRGETGLYVTLSESERELRLVAKRHGFSLDKVSIFELVPPEASLDPERELTLFHPAELELTETSKLIFDRVNEIKPSRIVFDSLSEMRLLAQNPLRYRRQVLALKHFFAGRRCTVLLLDDFSSQVGDIQLHSIAHGVIILQQLALDYGSERRNPLRYRRQVLALKHFFAGASKKCALSTFEVAITISSLKREASRSFPGLSPLSITGRLSESLCKAAMSSWMRCLEVDCSVAPAPCS